MSGLSYLAGGLVVICGAMLGRGLAARQLRRIRLLEGFLHFTGALRTAMLGQMLPVGEALESLCDAESPNPLAAHMLGGYKQHSYLGPEALFKQSAAALSAPGMALDSMQEAEEKALEGLFSGLSTADPKGAQRLFEGTDAALLECLQKAKQTYRENGRLYTSLGGICGAVLAILLM